MKKIKTTVWFLSILLLLMSFAHAENCDRTTLIYGKIYFYGYGNGSQVINADVEVYNTDVEGPLQQLITSTITNNAGNYELNISPDMTSQTQAFFLKANYGDMKFDYKPVNITCGGSLNIDFVVSACLGLSFPASVQGAVKYPEGGNAPGEQTTVYASAHPTGSGDFEILETGETNPTGDTTAYNIPVSGFQILNNEYADYDWPTSITVWMKPSQNHYYRYYNTEKGNYQKNCTSSISCGDKPSIDFYVLNRKNTNDACSYNDECLSGNCFNSKCGATDNVADSGSDGDTTSDQQSTTSISTSTTPTNTSSTSTSTYPPQFPNRNLSTTTPPESESLPDEVKLNDDTTPTNPDTAVIPKKDNSAGLITKDSADNTSIDNALTIKEQPVSPAHAPAEPTEPTPGDTNSNADSDFSLYLILTVLAASLLFVVIYWWRTN